jgi:hypothetical protein
VLVVAPLQSLSSLQRSSGISKAPVCFTVHPVRDPKNRLGSVVHENLDFLARRKADSALVVVRSQAILTLPNYVCAT